jgi:hypothetical protein
MQRLVSIALGGEGDELLARQAPPIFRRTLLSTILDLYAAEPALNFDYAVQFFLYKSMVE